MKKKVLITVCSLEIGGIERSLVGLLDVFDYERYDVDVLLFSKKGELLPFVTDKCNLLPEIPQCATLLEPIKDVLLRGHPMMAAARLYSKFCLRHIFDNVTDTATGDARAYSVLQKYWDTSIAFMPKLQKEYDIAISFMWPHHFVAQKVKAKKKFAWIHTDYTKMVVDARKDTAIWDCFDYISGVSPECGASFLQVYPQYKDRLVTIENVLPKSFVERSADAGEPEGMADSDVFRILTVGRYCFAKGFDRIARVCRILKDRGIRFCWYAIGYGGLENEILKEIEKQDVADCFVLLGKKTNPYPYMKACDLYAQPSNYEGKAVTVREAQMLAKPVLITDFQTARGQVQDGVDAVIVPQSEEGIADGIEELMRHPERLSELSENTKRFDYSNVQQIQNLYDLMEK